MIEAFFEISCLRGGGLVELTTWLVQHASPKLEEE
jgi:hypothetical protein